MAAVKAGRHFEAEGIEGGCSETGMQTEADVRGQLRLVVLKTESDDDALIFNPIRQVERDFKRIFCRGEIVGRDSIDEFVVAIRFNAMPDFAAKKTVGSAADFVAAIERALVLDPMQVVAHHGGVVRPTFLWRCDFVVVIEETNPPASGIESRDADQLRAELRNDEAESVRFVGENIEEP